MRPTAQGATSARQAASAGHPADAAISSPAGMPAGQGGGQAADPGASGQKPASLPSPAPIPAPTDNLRTEPERGTLTVEHDWEELVVPAESVLGLRIETPVSSERSRVEDRVDARVTRDVRVSGHVAIPAGTHAVGSVVLVERGGRMKDRPRIGVRFHTLVMADATRVAITTETFYREGESPAPAASARIGGAAIGGAIIGAILGGGKGAAIGSGIGAAGGTAAAASADRQSVILPAGATVSVRIQAPVTVTVER